ncbi:MFS transporter [Actinomadura sp. NBRC 104412]|uniref:MFS transporter n=1 Tax=Actinomadura sp. NBRC 104412 TaxID=3032203 RepID=UPI0024A2C9AB|nr:MFS transporter [Actinomadura sp. NBRC 104412]GLZ03332.1 MFS transporter [Actinomadura sp. NBRC 104412]
MTLAQSSPSREHALAPSGRRTPALVGIALGYFMVLLDMTVLSVAEPDLALSLHASTAGLQWATTGYTVVFGALLLSAGAVADRYGAHRVFRVGVLVFGAGSLSALAPTLGLLIALRAMLGAAGAACVPASMAMIARLYPRPAERSRAVAAWAAIGGAAVAVGPLAGGALVDAAGWRAVFLINVPIAVLVLALTAGAAVTCPRGDRRIDWAAQLAACATLALLTDTLVAAGTRAWTHTAASAAIMALMASVFVALERRSAAPVLEPALLRTRGVRAALAAGAAVNFALNGSLFVLPLLLRTDRHLGAAATGLAFLPLTLPFVLNPPLVGRLTARFGSRPPILTGMALLAAGGAALGAMIWARAGYAWLACGLLACGLGVSFVLPALVSALISAAPAGAAGAGAGLLNAVRQAGATLGVASMGAVVSLGAVTGPATALLLAALVCTAAGTWFALATPRHP